MSMNTKITGRLSAWSMAFATAATLGLASTAAQAIPQGCTGNCGQGRTPLAGEVVVAPPTGATYDWISTYNSDPGYEGIGLGTEINGSGYRTAGFSATAGSELTFWFNYVTSDGEEFADYAFARLMRTDLVQNPIYLLTARTKPTGDIIPGAGMPAIDATLTPASVPIIPNQTVWGPLGDYSGDCYTGQDSGCGYTGWVKSAYEIMDTGTYYLEFGVANWLDNIYHSGLAYSGALVCEGTDCKPVDPPNGTPEPGTLALLGLAALGLGAVRRRKVD